MLRITSVSKSISTQSNDKRSHLFIRGEGFADYAKTFKLEEMAPFDPAQKMTRSGFVSFTLKNAPTQVMHTLYISVPEVGSSLLFTSERLDLEKKLNLVSTQKTAADLSSYEMTPELSTQIKAWCESNGYDAKFIPAAEVEAGIRSHFVAESSSYECCFMKAYQVTFADDVLRLTGHGEQALTAMPSGLMTAKNLAKYLCREYKKELSTAITVDLRMGESAKGGDWNSQAQALSNELKIPVIGYEGRINAQGREDNEEASRKIFTPQTGKKKALTRTLNEMMGDRLRSSLLRKKPEWRHVSVHQLMNRIHDNPKAFLQKNLLTTALLNTTQPFFLNEIRVGSYQISNAEMLKHAKITADYLPVTAEVEILLSQSEGLLLSSLHSDFLVTTQLTHSTLAMKTLDGETFIAHVQPDFKLEASHDCARHINLQTELKGLGWHTFGPKDYKEVPTRVYGFKDKGVWRFYSQSGQDSVQRVQRIFRETTPFLYEDVVRNNRILRKKGNFIIKAPGVDGVTLMKTGLMSGEELYEYLVAKHEDGVVTSFEVHLHSSGSADGGVVSSQAQVLADLVKIPVVGYQGEFLNEELSQQNARKFEPRTDPNVKAATARRNRIKAKWEKLKLYSKNRLWSRETITDLFEPDPILPDFAFKELTSRENELIQEAKAFFEQDPKIKVLMQRPANRCLDTALQVYNLIEYNVDFSNIKIFNLGVWNQFLGKLAFSWANHYAIKANYKGIPIVIDPTAGQFPELGIYATPLFALENNWKAIYQMAWKNKPNFLLKLAEVDSFYDAPFSSLYSFSAFQHNTSSAETKILSLAKWYDKRMFDIYKKSRAQTKEMEEAFRASLTKKEADDLDFRFTWH